MHVSSQQRGGGACAAAVCCCVCGIFSSSQMVQDLLPPPLLCADEEHQLGRLGRHFHTAGEPPSEEEEESGGHAPTSLHPSLLQTSPLLACFQGTAGGPLQLQPHLLLQPEEEGVKEKWAEGSSWLACSPRR